MANPAARSPYGSPDGGGTGGGVRSGIFRSEGEYWSVGLDGRLSRLRHTKGLDYLAKLLRRPNVEQHALELIGSPGDALEDGDGRHASAGTRGHHLRVDWLTDAGELSDDRARAAYRRRLAELNEELTSAKRAGAVVDAERAEREIESLTRELSRAFGLHGRPRRAASAAERARQTVTKTMRSAIDRIARSDSELGMFLTRSIRTGTYCAYVPAPHELVAWQVHAAEDARGPRAVLLPDAQGGVELAQPGSAVGGARRTAFVGRDAEAATIRSLIDRAAEGCGAAIVLGGGPGVGKSRLAVEMAAYAERSGFGCLTGHCYEREEPFPYLPFVELLEAGVERAADPEGFRRLVGENLRELAQIAPGFLNRFPDVPAPVDVPPQQRRGHLFQSVGDALARAARAQPLLLIIEDVHWADESSLALLSHLTARSDRLPLVMVVTYRQGYADDNPALSRTLEELIRMGVRPLKLQGLPCDAVARMLCDLGNKEVPSGLVERIFAETQGNPFFIEETYKHLEEEGKLFGTDGAFLDDLSLDSIDVPENVRLVLSRRMARFLEPERFVLAAAATLGRTFDFALLRAVLASYPVEEVIAVIERAQRMGLLIAGRDDEEARFQFAHELMRQTVLMELSSPRRQQLHARAAAAIEQLVPDPDRECECDIAEHLVRAGSFADPGRLADRLLRAGRSAVHAAAFEEGLRHVERALSLLTDDTDARRSAALSVRAMAERGLGRIDATIATLREAVAIHRPLDEDAAVALFVDLAEALIWADRFAEAADTARQGLARMAAGNVAGRIALLCSLALSESMHGTYEAAKAAIDDASALAARIAEPRVEASVLAVRSIFALQFLHVGDAVAHALRSEQLGGVTGSPWLRGWILFGLRMAHDYMARPEQSSRISAELAPLSRRLGQPTSAATGDMIDAWIAFGRAPDLDRLDDSLTAAAARIRDAGIAYWDVIARAQLSHASLLRGDHAGARRHAEEACGLDIRSLADGISAGTLLRVLAYAGEDAEVRERAASLRARLPAAGTANAAGSWMLLAMTVESFAVIGAWDQVRALHPLAGELVATGAVWLWPVARFSRTVAGITAGAAADWSAAEEHFTIAAEQAAQLPNRIETADIARFHAIALLGRGAAGDIERASALLQQADAVYAGAGMTGHRALAAAQMERAMAR